MKIKPLAAITSLLGLCACSTIPTTPPIDTRVEIFLRPIHSVATGLQEEAGGQAQITDNDGNLYITYWDVDVTDYDTFDTRALACRDQFSEQRLFINALSIADFSVDDIKPSIYLPFIQCIHAQGYNLLNKEGYAPDEYRVTVSRAHSSHGNYMPIGGNYTLKKARVRYINVFQDVKACEAQALEDNQDGVVEEFSDGFVSASVEVFLDEMKDCLASRAYRVESDQL
jgi:hypothetical protein